ncbi:MAG: Hsp20/alpha crystallin family protein [Bacteriovoracaceae bacterium]
MYHFELRPAQSQKWVGPFGKEVEKLFEDFTKSEAFAPVCETVETEKAYVISLDIPGVAQEAIDIEVKEKHLYVTGERKLSEENESVLRSERRYGKFTRVFVLPQNVNTELIEAKFENGVLDIFLPKAEKAQSKKIAIGGQTKNESASTLKN